MPFLGHIITPEGSKPNTKKIEAIIKYPPQKTQTEVRTYLGSTGFYKKFIKNYAKIAKPLSDILTKKTKVDYKNRKFIKGTVHPNCYFLSKYIF